MISASHGWQSPPFWALLREEIEELKGSAPRLFQAVQGRWQTGDDRVPSYGAIAPLLVAALAWKGAKDRKAAARFLSRIGLPDVPGIERALLDAVRGPDEDVRVDIIALLPEVGRRVAVLSALREAIKDQAARVRKAAIEAISKLGPRLASGAVEELAQALGDGTEDVRDAAVAALQFLGEDATNAIPPLIDLLFRERDSAKRIAILRALLAIDSAQSMVLPAIENRALDGPARRELADLLGAIGDVAKGLQQAVRGQRASQPQPLGKQSEQTAQRENSTRGAPQDGDENELGHVYLAGAFYRFGPQQKLLLLWILKNPGGKAEQARKHLGYLTPNNLDKLLHELRDSLRKRLKNADRSLVIQQENRTLNYSWCPRQK
jgi:HEAT repeat protein